MEMILANHCITNSWSSQTSDFIIYICRFLARGVTLLGYSKDWLAQCQDNVTESDISSWQPGFSQWGGTHGSAHYSN